MFSEGRRTWIELSFHRIKSHHILRGVVTALALAVSSMVHAAANPNDTIIVGADFFDRLPSPSHSLVVQQVGRTRVLRKHLGQIGQHGKHLGVQGVRRIDHEHATARQSKALRVGLLHSQPGVQPTLRSEGFEPTRKIASRRDAITRP